MSPVMLALVPHLGVVAHPPQQPVGDARRASGAQSQLACPLLVDVHPQDVGRAPHDERQVVHRVVVQPVREAEAVAQRRGDEPRARGGADEREARQLQPDGAGAGPLPDDDVDLEVLHRRIEDLLDGPVEPVDLVDEEDVALLQVSEDGRHVGLALQRRARGGDDVDPHLQGDDVGQGGLAQPGRAGQQHVVQRLSARAWPPR